MHICVYVYIYIYVNFFSVIWNPEMGVHIYHFHYPLVIKHGKLENPLSMEVLIGQSLISMVHGFQPAMLDSRHRMFYPQPAIAIPIYKNDEHIFHDIS